MIYYVKHGGSDLADGLSDATAFATVTYAHSKAIPGDIIKLKRGSIFYEHFIPQKAGTALNPIQFEPYGDPELPLPIISGAKQLTGWVSIGNGLYKITDTGLAERVKFLRLDGEMNTVATYPRGREPNRITACTGNATGTISDNVNLNGKNFTGGEVVTKKLAWCVDTMKITNHVGDTLTFSGGSSTYNVTNGWGYFVQNHRACCTQLGDWCQEEKDIVMYFGAENPSDFVIQAPYVERIYFNNHGNNQFYDVSFEMLNGGSNLLSDSPCFLTSASQNLRFVGSHFEYMGNTVFHHLANNNNGFTILGGSVKNILNLFYWNRHNATTTNFTIENVHFENIAAIDGAGGNGSIGYSGIVFAGAIDGAIIRGNRFKNVGYNAVNYGGYEFLIENNFAENVCCIKDDGGAFYTFGKGDIALVYDKTRRVVKNNIVINSLGTNKSKSSWFSSGPSSGSVEAYYLDDDSNEITMEGNIAFNCNTGLRGNNTQNLAIKNNLFIGCKRAQATFPNSGNGTYKTRNVEFTGNVLYASEATQLILEMESMDSAGGNPTDLALIGNWNNNYYMRPSNESNIIKVIKTGSGANTWFFSLQGWKDSVYGHDADSKGTPSTSTIYELAINDTAESIEHILTRIRLDVDGNEVNQPFILEPFTAKLLLDDLGPINPIPIEEYTIDVTVFGSGSISGAGTYEDGQEVDLLATPNTGWSFLHWSDIDGIYLDNPLSFIAEGNRSLEAIFVEYTPPVEEYTVTVIPSTGGSVSGGGTYTEDDEATLTAIPNTGWHFVRWSNDVTDNPYSFAVTQDVTLQAIFAQDEPIPGVIIVKGKFRIV